MSKANLVNCIPNFPVIFILALRSFFQMFLFRYPFYIKWLFYTTWTKSMFIPSYQDYIYYFGKNNVLYINISREYFSHLLLLNNTYILCWLWIHYDTICNGIHLGNKRNIRYIILTFYWDENYHHFPTKNRIIGFLIEL